MSFLIYPVSLMFSNYLKLSTDLSKLKLVHALTGTRELKLNLFNVRLTQNTFNVIICVHISQNLTPV